MPRPEVGLNPSKKDGQIIAYEALCSMLTPKTEMKGLIASIDDNAMTKYRVPAGLTEKQAMLVVLGAITQDENLKKMATKSSVVDSGKVEWNKIWFIRDFLNDEGRGFGVGDAVEAGRRQAAEAFRAMENGNRSLVDRLLKDAADNIRFVYNREIVKDGFLWDNPEAAMSLLEEAIAEGGIDEIAGFSEKEQARIDVKKGITQIQHRYHDLCQQYKDLPEDASPEQRKTLLADIYACDAIVRDYNFHMENEPLGVFRQVAPEVPFENEKLVAKYPGIGVQRSSFTEDYLETHPAVMEQYVTSQEGRDVLMDAYREKIKNAEFYQNASLDKNASLSVQPGFSAQIELPDALSEERAGLEAAWQKKKAEYEESLLEETNNALGLNAKVDEYLEKFADSLSLPGFSVIGRDAVTRRYGGVGELLEEGLDLYVADVSLQKIYSIGFDTNGQLQAKKVDEISPSLLATSIANSFIYADEMRKAMSNFGRSNMWDRIDDLATLKDPNPEQEPVVNIAKNYKEFRNAIYEMAKSGNENNINDVRQKAEKLKADALAWIESDNHGKNAYMPPVNYIRDFCNSIIVAHEAAGRKLSEFKEHLKRHEMDENVVKNRLQVAKERAAKNEKRMADELQISEIVVNLPDSSRDTEVHANLDNLMNHIAKRTKGNELEADYVGLLGVIDELKNATNELYLRDEDGNFSSMTREKYSNLLDLYGKAINECDKARESVTDSIGLDSAVRELSGVLARDFAMLTAIDPTLEKSLPEVVANSRTRRIDITGKDFSKVGANSNVRLAMEVVENGSGNKVFLTKEERIEFRPEELEGVFETVVSAYPEYRDMIHRVRDVMFEGKTHEYTDAVKQVVEYCVEKNLLSGLSSDQDPDFIDEQVKAFKAEFKNAFDQKLDIVGFGDKIVKYITTLEATEGTSITNRNAAMSKIANILGMPDIIAHSEIVETVNNGKVEKGLIMDSAKGLDRDAIMPEDVKNLNSETGNHPALLKKIAELQALDYVCGNVDRNQNNYFYQFSNNGEKLVGIQGIDNDLSFHTARKKPDFVITYADVSLDGIEVIPKAVEQKLRGLSESAINAALMDTDIGKKEIANVYLNAQDIIRAIDDKRIRVVEDDEWAELDFNTLGERENSHFKKVKGQVDHLKTVAKANLEKKQKKALEQSNKKPFGFEKVQTVDGINEASREADARTVGEFITRIDDSQKDIWGSGSPQFRELERAIKSYKGLLQATEGRTPSDREYRQIQASLENIEQTAKNYIAIKANKTLSSKTQTRVDIATEAKEFAQARVAEFKKTLHRKDEMQVEDMDANLKAQAESIRQAAESADKMEKKFLEIASNEKENNEIRQLMMLGAGALDQVKNAIGKGDVSAIAGKNNNTLSALVMCNAIVDARAATGGKPGKFELGVIEQGAAKAITSMDNSPKMEKIKDSITVKSLTKMTAQKNFLEVLGEKQPKNLEQQKVVEEKVIAGPN